MSNTEPTLQREETIEAFRKVGECVGELVLRAISVIHDMTPDEYESTGSRMSKLLSRNDAANFLGISCSKLDSLRQSGKLNPTRIGRRVFFLKETLEAYYKANAK